MTTGLAIVFWTAALIALGHAAWWLLLSVMAIRRPPARASCPPRARLAVIVPAHNESSGIETTLRSLLAAADTYPSEIVVVADNCADDTARLARCFPVTVLERHDAAHCGKSFALDFALAHLAAQPIPPEAVVFVDADSTVSPGIFAALAGRIDLGSAAVQVHYAVAPGSTALIRLRRLAFALVHWARPLGATRLGLGTTLKGNGMALRWDFVRDGFAGTGLTEDAAMTLVLASRGIAVDFEPSATVWGAMAATYRQAAVQDRRWEGGRLGLLPRALRTAARAIARGDTRPAAGALEVASLPLTAVAGLASIAALGAAFSLLPSLMGCLPLGALAGAMLLGWLAARVSLQDLAALLALPRFIGHKLVVLAGLGLRRGPRTWQRTARD